MCKSSGVYRKKMTCDNIDSDATVFSQNCIIFVHRAMFCLKYDSVCIYDYARFCFMYSTRILRKHAKLLSFSCTCLLCRVACSLGMIAYILLYMHRLPTSSGSAVTHSARLPKGHHAEVNFDTFFSLQMLLFH